jgi:hypothetical protein
VLREKSQDNSQKANKNLQDFYRKSKEIILNGV